MFHIRKSLNDFIAIVCVTTIIASNINVIVEPHMKKYEVKASDVELTSAESDFTIVDGVLTKYNGSGGDVTIPKGVTSIDNFVFAKCVSLTNVTIPEGVTSIGKCAFSECTSLKNITIPNSMVNIGEEAFESCTSLISIMIPDSVTDIGDSAFQKCTSLTSVCISKNIKKINHKVFNQCSSLTRVTTSGALKLVNNNSNKIMIPNHVTSIGISAFNGCSSLTSVTIPDSVTGIKNYAFASCSSLTDINIPDSVTGMGDALFLKCSSLKNIIISKGVTIIYDSSFSGCTSLKNVTIPSGVIKISDNAFKDCTSLIITGEVNSYAIQYAQNKGYNYSIMDSTVTPTAIITPTPLPNQIDLKETDITLSKYKCYCDYKDTAKPSVTVKYNGTKLTKNRDYTIAYTENTVYGQGKVIITGIGTYTGVVEKTFSILPKKSKISSCKTCIFRKQKVMKLIWKKQKGVEGYQIVYAYSKKGKYKEMSKKDSNVKSYVFISPQKTIYIKIRAYVRVNGEIKYGPYSSIKKAVLK